MLRVALAGDVMTGRGIDQVLGVPSAPQLYESWVRDAREYVRLAEEVNGPIGRALPGEAIWGRALETLRELRPAVFVVNLETAVTVHDQPWPGKGIHYRMHPDNVGCLTAGGVDGCVLANNHVVDWGLEGLDETLRTLRAAGLSIVGAGEDAAAAWRPAIWTTAAHGELRLIAAATASSGVPPQWAASESRSGIALLPDLQEASAQRVAQALKPRRGRSACKVVSIHWGENWVERVPDAHRRFAHLLIDVGAADVVHGHSSHHPLPVEVYRNRLILYGCGDLINDYEGIAARPGRRSDVGCLYLLELDPASARLQNLEIVPMQLRRFRLGQADAQAREWVMAQLNGECERFGARIVTREGRWLLQWSDSSGPD